MKPPSFAAQAQSDTDTERQPALEREERGGDVEH